MYPPQTSFIPITVALARYIEQNGFSGNYPFWYLGTTPFKYLSGPVVPYILVFLKKALSAFSFFDLVFVLIAIGFLMEAAGWAVLAGFLSKNKKIGLIVGVLSLIMPWHIVSALGLGETSAVVASALTPWVIFAFAKVESGPFDKAQGKKWKVKSVIVAAISFSILLLTNTTAAVPAIIGILLLSFSTLNFQLSTFKRVFAVVLLGWLLTLWWYSPGYWLTVWGAPGIGGKNLIGVLTTLANFLRGFLPVVAVILIVFWKIKLRTEYAKFTLGWVVLFGSLTLFRFMADWDFWMDWTAWISEVEVGVVLLITSLISQDSVSRKQLSVFSSRLSDNSQSVSQLTGKPKTVRHESDFPQEDLLNKKRKTDNRNSSTLRNKFSIFYLLFTICFIVAWFLAWQNRSFWLPRTDITRTVEYKIADWFSNNLTIQQFNNSTIFLSGTTAFWLNSLVDVKQVRGGRDEGAVDSKWREAVWEIREGDGGSRSVETLRSLGVDYLVVHTDKSSEYYHDFKYPEKFEGRQDLEKVYEKDGDVIYQIE